MNEDTTIFVAGRSFTLSASMKAALVYVSIDVAVNALVQFGQMLYELKQEDWSTWWTPRKVGWVMMQVGNVLISGLLMLKAFFSNSSKPTMPSTTTV